MKSFLNRPGSAVRLPGLVIGAAAFAGVALVAAVACAAEPQAKHPRPPLEPAPKVPVHPYTPHPDSARVAFQIGLAAEQQGHLETALRAYRVAVASDSAFPEASYRLGLIYSAIDRPNEAANAYANEIRHHGDHVKARRELGLSLCRMGRTKDGLPFLEQLTERFPDDDENWQALGFGYSIAGRLADAENALRKAIANPPERASEHRDLGVVLVSLGRIEDARNEYRAAIAIDDRDPTPWTNLGNLELREKHYDRALDAYRSAEARDSASAGALEGQYQALQALNRPQEAAETCMRWLRRRPDDDHARLEAARAWHAAGRDDLAYAIAARGVRRNPRSGDARLVLSIVLDTQGRTRESLTQLRAAERLFPDPLNRGRVRQIYGSTLAAAPDSLRALAQQDSIAEIEKLMR